MAKTYGQIHVYISATEKGRYKTVKNCNHSKVSEEVMSFLEDSRWPQLLFQNSSLRPHFACCNKSSFFHFFDPFVSLMMQMGKNPFSHILATALF